MTDAHITPEAIIVCRSDEKPLECGHAPCPSCFRYWNALAVKLQSELERANAALAALKADVDASTDAAEAELNRLRKLAIAAGRDVGP